MKKGWKILLVLLIVIVGSGSILAIYQRENIKALYFYMAYPAERIEDRLNENDQAINEAIQKITENPVRTLTEEEEQLLAAGELNLEDALSIIAEAQEASEATDDVQDEGEADTDVTSENDALAGLVAEAYVLRSYFTGSLESLKNQAISEYKALPQEERTTSKKGELMLKYMGLGGSLESECDGLMENLIARIESELAQSGGDTSVVQEIRSLYAEEKALRKASYMSMYN